MRLFCKFLRSGRASKITDSTTSPMPETIAAVNFSPRKSAQNTAADAGSNAPRIAVIVGPAYLTANAMKVIERRVGNTMSPATHKNSERFLGICGSPARAAK